MGRGYQIKELRKALLRREHLSGALDEVRK